MNRRQAGLAGGVGLAAAAVGWGLWRWRESSPTESAGFWSMSFETPDGGQLMAASLRNKPLVLNFWATWCAPCVREMPALDRFHRERVDRGWQVVGIAADKVDAVRDFLKHTPVGFPIAMAGFAGLDLARQLGNTAGGLPFTAVFDRSGRIVKRHAGESRYDDLVGWTEGIS